MLANLSSFWQPKHHKYVEPFMGSACLFFHLGPSRAVLSDLNKELVETFREVRRAPIAIFNELGRMRGDEASFYIIRARDPDELTPVSRAARFIYLNRYCFNGLYRTNQNGTFNVPYGGRRNGRLPTRDELLAAANALKNKSILTGDFETVVRKRVCAGDFVYLDPPYYVESKRVFRQYGKKQFRLDDIERLSSVLCHIDSVGAHFVVSYLRCAEIRSIAKHWNVHHLKTMRQISGFVGGRALSHEIVVTNIDRKKAFG